MKRIKFFIVHFRSLIRIKFKFSEPKKNKILLFDYTNQAIFKKLIKKKIEILYIRLEEINLYVFFKTIKSFGFFNLGKNYIKTIRWLEQNNYNVFIHTLDLNVINILNNYNLKNTYFVNSFINECDTKILSLYLYIKSSLHICQNSGSHLLAHILNTKIIMLDHYPITEGCPKGDILCPAILSGNKIMQFKDYYKTDFLFGKGIDFKNTKILPNTEDEIFQIVSRNFTNVKKINYLIPDNCLSKYRSNEIYASF